MPTALLYKEGGIAFGQEALGPDASIGFKLALGDIRPGQSPHTRHTFPCSDGERRSAFQLSQDFLDKILASVDAKLPAKDNVGSVGACVVVAEPLKFQVEDRKTPDWLSNYRRNVTRILRRFKRIEFLPEPFAVYQYYKYGLRIPKLADRTKRFALILDMGGGTFDACIIETTSEGDVSSTGNHSKPLSASSVPYAGLHLDRQIALYLLKKNAHDDKKDDVERYYKQYERTLRGNLDRLDLRTEAQAFMANMDALRPLCEHKKIELATAIVDWRLDAEKYDRVEIDVPVDPLAHSDCIPTEFYGHQMYAIFERLWNDKLKRVVHRVMRGASDRLKGGRIDVSLISGGSANVAWLAALLKRDFGSELAGAEPVNIGASYQDVVANGLAIECARRHFSTPDEAPEFVAVTYNPVRLLLAPDSPDFKAHRFRSVDDKVDMQRALPGDLVPSSHAFCHFFDRPLRWQVRLPTPPNQYLSYLFCRPSDRADKDTAPLDLAYNLEEWELTTSLKSFDAKTTVELTVREDGTAVPKFIYKLENKRGGVEENSETGRPFYIDMTTGAAREPVKSYVGLDFGTSNSSICLLADHEIELVDKRETSGRWRGLSDALTDIPYPAAVAIRRLLSEHDAASIFDVAIEAYEACLAMLAYSAAADVLYENERWGGLRNFPHRAMGPLKALLVASTERRATCGCIRDRTAVEGLVRLEEALHGFTEGKHHKTSRHSPKWVDYVDDIARATVGALAGNLFGYCATSDKIPYQDRFEGTFMVAHDQPPFVRHYRYTSTTAIDSTVALMLDPERRKARSLTPLLVWDRRGRDGERTCYLLDSPRRSAERGRTAGEWSYKPCHTAGVAAASDIDRGLSEAVDALLTEGSFVTGEVDLEVAEVGAAGDPEAK